ncbi:MAG: hypothetical protein ACRD1N_02540 [Terriglobia bacterium]
MRKNQWLVLVMTVLSFYCVGCIWLTQISCYPLWALVGSREFVTYHVAWWHSIWGVDFVPAGLVFLGSIAMIWLRPEGVSRWMVWTGLALQVAIYAATALWWAPLMAGLATPQTGLLPERYHLLITTHWMRVAMITAYGLLVFWMLVRSFDIEMMQPSVAASST